jgi:hypothetical protein
MGSAGAVGRSIGLHHMTKRDHGLAARAMSGFKTGLQHLSWRVHTFASLDTSGFARGCSKGLI